MVRDIKSSGFWVVLPVLDPAFLFSPFSCHLEFLVSLLKDRFFPSFELVFRGDISDGAVKANLVPHPTGAYILSIIRPLS